MVERTIAKAMNITGTLKDYLLLTKPGIVLLVLITTLAGMYLAYRGMPDAHLILYTLLGTSLASAGSAVLNQYLERDIDSLMVRTSKRPLPLGNVQPTNALIFGVSLISIALILLAFFVNLLTTFLTALASFTYVVIYTWVLKRKTPVATEIGGISGALPPVIGYAAVSETVSIEALILFVIMFLWQPPHFWVLAIKYAEDYKRANIPTLPVSKGLRETKIKTIIYTASLLPVSLTPTLIGMTGSIYLYSALLLSLTYLGLTFVFFISKKPNSMLLFFFSILYIALLFSLMVFDMRRW